MKATVAFCGIDAAGKFTYEASRDSKSGRKTATISSKIGTATNQTKFQEDGRTPFALPPRRLG